MIYYFSLFFTTAFWPLSLYLSNTRQDFLEYTIPALLILVTYFAKVNGYRFFQVPLFFIPIIEPKLAILPLLFLIFDSITERKWRSQIIFIIISVFIFIFYLKPFMGQTIFVPDYEAKQKVIRDTQLYPSILMARTFHNKARIIADKFVYNFFALTDPNNYFFGFHPRQIVGNQNLIKYSFPAVIFFLAAIINIGKLRNSKLILTFIFSSVFSLSLLTNFDRNDFILSIPLSFLIMGGLNEVKKHPLSNLILLFYLIFSSIEFLRVMISYS